jgi:DNA-binding NarL/FixJ family response regulator
MFRACLRQLLTAPPAVLREVYGVDMGLGLEVVGEAGGVEETVAVVRSMQPDLLLLAPSMPQMSGLDILRELEVFRSRLRTIVLAAAIDRGLLLSAVELGAHGVLMKDSPTELLFEAITSVMAGECWVGRTLVSDLMDALRSLIRTPAAARRPRDLTTREQQILTMVVAGYPNREIARVCNVSEETVKHHLTRIFEKVGATNRVELAMKATQGGLLAHL